MSELFEEKLQRLNEDELLIDAIRWIFNQEIEKANPVIETGDTNVILGEKYRAYDEARRVLGAVFVNIKSFKVNNNNSKGFNKAK